MFIYHFSAFYQISVGEIIHVDGIATLDDRIVDFNDYVQLKTDIIRDRSLPIVSVDKFTITSLTHLNPY